MAAWGSAQIRTCDMEKLSPLLGSYAVLNSGGSNYYYSYAVLPVMLSALEPAGLRKFLLLRSTFRIALGLSAHA